MVSWNELVSEAQARFEKLEVPEPAVSARWIGRQATGADAAEWLEIADRPATKRQVASFDRMVERRCEGEPLQYVLGSWGFRTLDLFVDRRVLIPRPETETVAERALAETDRALQESPDGVVVDLGTGSGAIGLAIAVERPGTEIWLTDVSAEALQVARANLAGTGRAGGTVRLAEGDWFGALPSELVDRVAVVVSNPPYVASPDDLEPQVAAWEPISALVAEEAGTAHLVRLIDEAPRWLIATGSLVLEMAPDQVDSMMDRAAERFEQIEQIDDLAGRARGLVARFPRNGT
ncbi:MAG: peptide chain release factor N(5)-glutamine methyltransferase [Acidimicrobiales bacterium]